MIRRTGMYGEVEGESCDMLAVNAALITYDEKGQPSTEGAKSGLTSIGLRLPTQPDRSTRNRQTYRRP